jgi:hypothetical protein
MTGYVMSLYEREEALRELHDSHGDATRVRSSRATRARPVPAPSPVEEPLEQWEWIPFPFHVWSTPKATVENEYSRGRKK